MGNKTTPSVGKFYYGGQAVIEGVMIRGRRFFSVAVRRPDGQVASVTRPLHSMYTGLWRRFPLVRGVIVLVETLMLGMKALSYSASVAMEREKEEMGKGPMALMLAFSLAVAIGVFLVGPLLLVRLLDSYIASRLLSNFVEGIIRLDLFLAYLWLIGRMPDIRRVFAYHGAEHMAVHAYEAGEPLEASYVRRYPTAHPRCGTAFLLVVVVMAIFVFAFSDLLVGNGIAMRLLSRVLLVPAIAGLGYEVLRFSGRYYGNRLVRTLMAPSLALQAMTTRQPDEAQMEVAIQAMKGAIAADEGGEQTLPGKG